MIFRPPEPRGSGLLSDLGAFRSVFWAARALKRLGYGWSRPSGAPGWPRLNGDSDRLAAAISSAAAGLSVPVRFGRSGCDSGDPASRGSLLSLLVRSGLERAVGAGSASSVCVNVARADHAVARAADPVVRAAVNGCRDDCAWPAVWTREFDSQLSVRVFHVQAPPSPSRGSPVRPA